MNHNNPTRPATLVELLRQRAEAQPDKMAYTFLQDGEIEEASLTYAELDRQARAIAAKLQDITSPASAPCCSTPPAWNSLPPFSVACTQV